MKILHSHWAMYPSRPRKQNYDAHLQKINEGLIHLNHESIDVENIWNLVNEIRKKWLRVLGANDCPLSLFSDEQVWYIEDYNDEFIVSSIYWNPENEDIKKKKALDIWEQLYMICGEINKLLDLK